MSGVAKVAITFGACVIVLAALTLVTTHIDNKPHVTPTQVAASGHGFWKTTTQDGGKDQAYFCQSDGSYQGRIVDSGQGWYDAYVGHDERHSFANEDFAKREIESHSNCK